MGKIKLKDIKEQYILPALANKGYRFKVFTTAGAYVRTRTNGRIRQGVVNTFLQVTESDIMYLGGGLKASAVNVTMTFLIPVPNTPKEATEDGYGGEYEFLEEFRDMLTDAFATTEKLTLQSGGKTYIGGVSATFPMTGELAQRQQIGASIEYSCYLQFTYLQGAVNSSDVQFFLDDDTSAIPYTKFSIARKNTVSAALQSNAGNGEGSCYAESSSFAIDLSLPAIDPLSSKTGLTIYKFLMGISNANEVHRVKIKFVSSTLEIERDMIFSEVTNEGSGVENVAAKISFVPYMETEDESA